MKKGTIVNVNETLNDLKVYGELKFRYLILKNLTVFKDLVSPINTVHDLVKEQLKDFEEDRNKIIMEIGKKDKDKVYIDSNDKELVALFIEKVEELSEKHKDAFIAYEDKLKQYNELLEEEADDFLDKLTQIPVSVIPQEVTTEQLELLMNVNLIVE